MLRIFISLLRQSVVARNYGLVGSGFWVLSGDGVLVVAVAQCLQNATICIFPKRLGTVAFSMCEHFYKQLFGRSIFSINIDFRADTC